MANGDAKTIADNNHRGTAPFLRAQQTPFDPSSRAGRGGGGHLLLLASMQWWELDDGTAGGSRRRRAAQAAKRRNQEKESLRRKQLKTDTTSANEDGKKSSDLNDERTSHHRHTGHERGSHLPCHAYSDIDSQRGNSSTPLRRSRFRFDASDSSDDETDGPLSREERREIELRLARHKKAKKAGLIEDSKPIKSYHLDSSDSDDSTPIGETWRRKYWMKKKPTQPTDDAPAKEDTQEATPKLRNVPTQNVGAGSATRPFVDDELCRASATSTYATAKGNPDQAFDTSKDADSRPPVAAAAVDDDSSQDPSETSMTQPARRRGRRAAINDCVDSRRVIMDEQAERVEDMVEEVQANSGGGDGDDKKSPSTKSDDEDDEEDNSKGSQAEAKAQEKPCATVVSKLPSEVDATSDATPIMHPNPQKPRFKISDSDRGCWRTQRGCLLVRTVDDEPARTKVAAFDLDNTLVAWRTSHPSSLEQYELWNSCVVNRLRSLHDDGGYKLVIITNQGGIRKSLYGATATKVQNIVEWIARLVDRPLFAVASTDKEQFHKPKPDMWDIMVNYTNSYKNVDKSQSFYVGDSDGVSGGSYQMKGVDLNFAINAGVGKFYSPSDYFGQSNAVLRRLQTAEVPPPPLPDDAIRARKALLGGYREGSILLLTVGVQGAGKSSFCEHITRGGSWCHFSQDTISGGKKGSREAVERAVEAVLKDNKSVVVDRMHLSSEQRRYFVDIGRRCNVPVHAIVFLASADEVRQRVLDRTNHPGGVEGERLCHLGANNLINGNLIHPEYDEGFELISYSHEKEGRLWDAYRAQNTTIRKSFQLFDRQDIPSLSLGTMSMKSASQVVAQSIEQGIQSIDTAPTYNNEADVGRSILNHDHVKLTIKVPLRARTPEAARKEAMESLSKLGKSKAHLILIHWPCDLIECGTLDVVWRELEQMKKEGLCDAIGRRISVFVAVVWIVLTTATLQECRILMCCRSSIYCRSAV